MMANELKQLEVYRQLDQTHPVDLVPDVSRRAYRTPGISRTGEKYIDLLCDELIPALPGRDLARFCDVFVEDGAYTVDEASEF